MTPEDFRRTVKRRVYSDLLWNADRPMTRRLDPKVNMRLCDTHFFLELRSRLWDITE